MHARNVLPVIVGGTAYWIQHLLFPNRLLRDPTAQINSGNIEYSPIVEQALASLPGEQRQLFDSLPLGNTRTLLLTTTHCGYTPCYPLLTQRWPQGGIGTTLGGSCETCRSLGKQASGQARLYVVKINAQTKRGMISYFRREPLLTFGFRDIRPFCFGHLHLSRF